MAAMPKAKVLIIEDDEDILELVRYNLSKEGFKTVTANTGEKGLELFRSENPNLVILDLMLPGLDGLDVCRAIRSAQDGSYVPIIMLTAKGEEADVVSGLELGADDYIVKPFSPRVLIARMRSVQRRHSPDNKSEGGLIKQAELTIDPQKHQAWLRDEQLELTFTEFQLLQFLAKKPGWVFSRYQIVDAVRGENYHVTARAVDVQIAGLRKKLGSAGAVIETVRGVGYRFAEA